METPRAFRTPGQLILFLLDERGWMKRTLAVVLGVGEATITRITSDERGAVPVVTLAEMLIPRVRLAPSGANEPDRAERTGRGCRSGATGAAAMPQKNQAPPRLFDTRLSFLFCAVAGQARVMPAIPCRQLITLDLGKAVDLSHQRVELGKLRTIIE